MKPATIKIQFSTENDGFESSMKHGIAYVLGELARRFRAGQFPSTVMDANGNACGKIEYEGDRG